MKKYLLPLSICIILILSVKFITPVVALAYVNSTINNVDGLQGNIDELELSIFSGKYSVIGINILQKTPDSITPIFAAQQIDITLSLVSLFSGEIVTSITLTKPTILAFDAGEEQQMIKPVEIEQETWLGLADDLTPFYVDEIKVVDGQVQFRAIGANVFGELLLTRVNGTLTDLHNDATSSLLTSINFEGLIADTAGLRIDGRLNPNNSKPSFDFNVEIDRVPHSITDEIVDIYAPFDIEAGELDLAAELVSDEGVVDGYVKVGVFNLDVFSWEKDVVEDGDNIFQLLIEGLSGMFSELIENGDNDSIATRFPVRGTLTDTNVPISTAILGLFRNAFIEAYNMKLEDVVSFEKATKAEASPQPNS